MTQLPEVWLRGPVAGVSASLMPAVHALLQIREELERSVPVLTGEQFWRAPGSAGSVGFHLKHLTGSLDRLLTYARGESLDSRQMTWLKNEAAEGGDPAAVLATTLRGLDEAVQQISATDPEVLFEERRVGRAGLPSNVWGLIFHAAEHSQRHAGQIATTIKVVTAAPSSASS